MIEKSLATIRHFMKDVSMWENAFEVGNNLHVLQGPLGKALVAKVTLVVSLAKTGA